MFYACFGDACRIVFWSGSNACFVLKPLLALKPPRSLGNPIPESQLVRTESVKLVTLFDERLIQMAGGW